MSGNGEPSHEYMRLLGQHDGEGGVSDAQKCRGSEQRVLDSTVRRPIATWFGHTTSSWAMTESGRRLKVQTLMDAFTHEYLDIHPTRHFTTEDAIRIPAEQLKLRGDPSQLR